jgi:signal transduction histidine kinase
MVPGEDARQMTRSLASGSVSRQRSVRRWLLGWHPIDVLVALPFVVIGQLDVWRPFGDNGPTPPLGGPRPAEAVLMLIAISALLWRRRWPLAVLAVMAAVNLIQILALSPTAEFYGGLLPVLVAVYSAGAHDSRWQREGGLLACIVTFVVIVALTPRLHNVGGPVFGIAAIVVAWTVGQIVGARGQRAGRLSVLALRLHAEQADEARRATASERARIARELHDVIAHNVSVIVVQAVAALGAAEDSRGPQHGCDRDVISALNSIECSAREALAEMRRLVGILHDDEGLALAPPPGLSSLGTLIENLRAAGLPVEFAIEGTPRELAAGVDLSAYRIVQEALTNVVKHAAPATASVRVRYQAEQLELLVEDDGSKPVPTPAPGGHGLIGMRERAAIYGGTMQASARPGSGFTVRARFPLEPEPS